MNKIQQLFSALIIVLVLGGALSCKKTFDAPPGPSDDLNIVANTSIQVLKSRHTVASQIDVIGDDIIICGIVSANDKSGNFYKQLFIQDTSGAMQIMIDASSLYATYPVGRRVYVKCKGLALSDYKGNMQLGIKADVGGVPSVQGIPAALVGQYVLGGSINNPVEPIVVTLNQLSTAMSDRYINALVKLEDFEFDVTNVTYSDTSSYKSTVNRTFSKGCGSKESSIIRTSAYANFAAQTLPVGHGSITAVYTVYTTTKQFIIRDTSDVQFNAPRCVIQPPSASSHISIRQLRSRYVSAPGTKITDSVSISGIVISDAANGNLSTGSVVIQDGDNGINVYFGPVTSVGINIGDSISFYIVGDSLKLYKGAMELDAYGTVPSVIATGRSVTPSVKTINEINTALTRTLGDPLNFEYTLVKILGATATPAGTFSGNKTLTDGSSSPNTMTLYTKSTATFAGQTMPTVASSWIGYPSKYNTTIELQMRSGADVQ